MQLPKILKAFTLVELLVVMAIFGLMLFLSGGMSARTRNTFVAQQFIKTAVQNARILRRKSMLITRNSSETQWVQGIGFRLEKDDTLNQWKMSQVKALSATVSGNYFYQSFPTNVFCIDFSNNCASGLSLKILENTSPQLLPIGMNVIIKDVDAKPIVSCTSAITVIYESINGKMHAYCMNGTGGVNKTMTPDPNLKISIEYSTKETYKILLNLKSDGEINAIQ